MNQVFAPADNGSKNNFLYRNRQDVALNYVLEGEKVIKNIPQFSYGEVAADDSKTANANKNAKKPGSANYMNKTRDIIDPNPVTKNDHGYIMRRAIILRRLLERKFDNKGAMPINQEILRAMLLIPFYKLGEHSIAAVLEIIFTEDALDTYQRGGVFQMLLRDRAPNTNNQSGAPNMDDLARGAARDPASLPFYAQLSLHVDAGAFIRLVLRDAILNDCNELLAKAIHEDYLVNSYYENYLDNPHCESYMPDSYCENYFEKTMNEERISPNMVPWDELGKEGRESCRKLALDIPNKLLAIGCSFDAGDTPYESLEEFTRDEILRLAQEEHIRWMVQKTMDGWTYAPIRDDGAKNHPCLVKWEDLPLVERQKDVNIAENIIPLLKKAGLRIYRIM